MFLFLFCMSVILALAGSFYGGARYGREVEAESIAVALRIESYGRQEYVEVIRTIKALSAAEFARVKKYL